MKKYIGLIFPLILPYLFVLGIGGTLFFNGVIFEKVFGNFPNFVFWLAIVLLLALIATVTTAILAIKRQWSAKEVATANMIVKILQIPAYVLIFFEGIYFSMAMMLLTQILGIIFVIFDIIVIFMTGIMGAVAAWRTYKECNTDKTVTVILGIGQFIFCVDIIFSILLFLASRSGRKGVDIHTLKTKMEEILMQLGFKKETVGEKKYEYFCYGNNYCVITYIEALKAFVIESADNLIDAANRVLVDGDLYYINIPQKELLDEFKNDVIKHYMD